MGNEALAQKILMGFAEDMPRQIRVLREMLDTDRLSDATRQAHTIKGATATVGGESVCVTAAAIEKSGRNDDAPAMRNRLDELEAGMNELLRVIGQGLKL